MLDCSPTLKTQDQEQRVAVLYPVHYDQAPNEGAPELFGDAGAARSDLAVPCKLPR